MYELYIIWGELLKYKTCCFTGHRNIDKNNYSIICEQLKTETIKLINRGIKYFGAGGALGFDTLAALCILDIKSIHPQIKLILVLPCASQSKGWNEPDKKIYNDILLKADKIVYTSEHYTKNCMHIRNRHLVNNSSYCICYLKEQTGGTAFTVGYAIRKNLKVINIYEEV